MDCTDIKALLSALLDDHLDAPSLHRAERHLAECRSCRNFVSEAERNERLIAEEVASAFSGDGPPEGFEQAVLSRTIHAPPLRELFRALRSGLRPHTRSGGYAADSIGRYALRRPSLAWTAWLGWVAAAAALLLLVTTWQLDRNAAVTSTARGLAASISLSVRPGDDAARPFADSQEPTANGRDS